MGGVVAGVRGGGITRIALDRLPGHTGDEIEILVDVEN